MTQKLKTAIALTEQILEVAVIQDERFKREMFLTHQAEKAHGESWMVFHLKTLGELLQEAARQE